MFVGWVTWLAVAQPGMRDANARRTVEKSAAAQTKLDLNQAGLQELRRLPGITSQLADRIVKNRPYRKLDDLVTRKILGKKQFARIREQVVVGRALP